MDKQYTDQLSEDEWGKLFKELAFDARNFYGSEKVFNHESYKKNVAAIKAKSLPEEGVNIEGILEDIRQHILPGAIHQHHENYIAFPDKGSQISAQYAAMLATLINQNSIAEDKSAPTGTYVEMAVISWLRSLINWHEEGDFPKSALDIGGAFVTGGVMANTLGLLAARQKTFPESKAKGMRAINKTPKVFVAGPTMNHYSHFGASWWLGIGTENVVEVACTEKGNMDQEDLIRKIEACQRAGDKPMAIIALAGDSRTNTIDDIPGIYNIAQKYKVWLHVDACHGGLLAFDDTMQHAGKHFLSYADSITMDPHKHLGIPYANSMILFKNPKDLTNIGSSTDITIAYGSNDIGQVTPFMGSRVFDALKLYAVILQYGRKGIKRNIEKRKEIASTWHGLLANSPLLMPLHKPELFAVAFSVQPGTLSVAELSNANKKLHDTLYKDGKVVVHSFDMCDYRNTLGYGKGTRLKALGSIFGSDTYKLTDLRDILTEIEATYKKILAAS